MQKFSQKTRETASDLKFSLLAPTTYVRYSKMCGESPLKTISALSVALCGITSINGSSAYKQNWLTVYFVAFFCFSVKRNLYFVKHIW